MSDRQRRRKQTLDRQAGVLTVDRGGGPVEIRAIYCPLCERHFPENSWELLTMEDAPPKQYGSSRRERCLTCKACNNGPGGRFEKRAYDFNIERSAALERASRPSPLFTSRGEALRLATVPPDEKLLEIKSSFIIAFVTLGFTYATGPGLDQVRELIAGRAELGSVPTCATVSASQVPEGDWVFIFRAPIECVVVTHPARHNRRPGIRHVVFLPMPSSEAGFYFRLSLLMTRTDWQWTGERHRQPGSRRIPRYWDRHGSEHGYSGLREVIDLAILESKALPPPFTEADRVDE